MNASKFFLKAANSLVTAVVALFLILAAAYSGYALWDNAQVYGAVDDIQSQLLKLKPDPECSFSLPKGSPWAQGELVRSA